MRDVRAGLFPVAYAVSGPRAVRVALAAATGFHLFRYGLDSPVAAHTPCSARWLWADSHGSREPGGCVR
ncbi:hypothetical protein M2162_000148 [Streptomyces sp. SAI-041]|nr:hypothetical protein [Streptomyces sp. SAI-041]